MGDRFVDQEPKRVAAVREWILDGGKVRHLPPGRREDGCRPRLDQRRATLRREPQDEPVLVQAETQAPADEYRGVAEHLPPHETRIVRRNLIEQRNDRFRRTAPRHRRHGGGMPASYLRQS